MSQVLETSLDLVYMTKASTLNMSGTAETTGLKLPKMLFQTVAAPFSAVPEHAAASA